MAVIQPEEYNQNYFDGKLGDPHPEGYWEYERSNWMDGELGRFLQGLNPAVLANKKVLELGCAKGFLVEDLRGYGVDAYGIDISQYAIDNAPTAVQSFASVGDIRDLSSYNNKEFDYVYSVRVLGCLDPNDLPVVIDEINRISKNQIHIIDEPSYGSTNYYNLQTKENWLNYSFPKNTRIYSYQTWEYATK